MLQIYRAALDPDDVESPVGGGLGAEFGATNQPLFPEVQAYPAESEDTFRQYRKLFIKNSSDQVTYYDVRVWISSIEHAGQIHLGIGTAADQIATGTSVPSISSTWSEAQNYTDGLALGSLGPGSSAAIWVRQSLKNITESDPHANIQISAAGTTL